MSIIFDPPFLTVSPFPSFSEKFSTQDFLWGPWGQSVHPWGSWFVGSVRASEHDGIEFSHISIRGMAEGYHGTAHICAMSPIENSCDPLVDCLAMRFDQPRKRLFAGVVLPHRDHIPINGNRLIPSLKKMPSLPVPRVEPCRVGPMKPLRRHNQVSAGRRHQGMIMTTHQHVTQNSGPAPLPRLPPRSTKTSVDLHHPKISTPLGPRGSSRDAPRPHTRFDRFLASPSPIPFLPGFRSRSAHIFDQPKRFARLLQQVCFDDPRGFAAACITTIKTEGQF